MSAHTVGDRDGTLALIQGQLILVQPQGKGSFPTIAPGEGVDIWVAGRLIREATVVTAAADVKIKPRYRNGKRQIKVALSPDKLQASIQVYYDPGEQYSLPQITPAPTVVVAGIKEKGLPPITVAEVKAELVRSKVCVGIDEDAIRQAVEKADGNPVVVAEGTPPGESRDAWIEYLFSREERVIRPAGEERVDYRERVEIPTVAPGTVIAVKHPPQLGTPGMAVTGETIGPRIPKDVAIRAGKGVKVSPDGGEALATIGGRPVVTGRGRVEVMSALVQRGDVDLSTGNINFHGDVEVYGKVAENMRIRAGGNITIYRNVSHAQLEAAGSITIKANLIGGSIRAGGLAALYRQVQPLLEKILGQLQGLEKALAQLLNHPQFQAQAHASGPGPILHLLVEQKFPQLPALAEELAQYMKEEKDLREEDRRLALKLRESLRGINIQRLSGKDLQHFSRVLSGWVEKDEAAGLQQEDISLYYAQNARIEATGLVTIRGPGSYHSNIVAGRGVSVTGTPGVVRGGVVQSFGDVFVKEVGSPGGTPTVITCTEDSRMELNRVYPNVVIQVGGSRHKFDTVTTGVRARLYKGELRLD